MWKPEKDSHVFRGVSKQTRVAMRIPSASELGRPSRQEPIRDFSNMLAIDRVIGQSILIFSDLSSIPCTFFCWLVDILPISFRATSPTVPLGGPNKWLNGPSSWLLLGLRSPSCSLNHLDTPKPGDLKRSSNRTKMGLDIKGLSNWYKLMRIRRIGASSCTFFGRKKRRKNDGKVWWAWRLQLNMVEPYMIFQDFRASFYLENPSNLHTVLEAVVFDDSPSAHLRSQRRPCTTEGSR